MKPGRIKKEEKKGVTSGTEQSGAINRLPLEDIGEPLKNSRRGKPYNFLHELLKGVVGICLLVSVLATFAMLADIYFNNSFIYLKNLFLNHPYKTLNAGKQIVSAPKKTDSDNLIFEVFDDQPDPKKESPQSNKVLPNTNQFNSKATSADKAQTLTGNGAVVEPDKIKYRGEKPNSISKHPESGTCIKPTSADTVMPKKVTNSPCIAIIIDDMGYDSKMAESISHIDKNITISILPGSPYARQIANALHVRGTQILLHLPMEPIQYPSVNPGFGTILSDMTPDEIINVLTKNLEDVPYVSGVNNHMGSRLTTLAPQMQQIFRFIKEKRLFFIDSLTSNQSVCRKIAGLTELSFASRDIFLDNIKDKVYIKKQLKKLIHIARQSGSSIAIGHPYEETYLVLKEEMPNLRKKIRIVPVSELVTVE